jgi:tetratricopeptide (TPR) repeat protein
LQENDFVGLATGGNATFTVGTYSRDLQDFNNEIRRNTYQNLTYGNRAEGDNAAGPTEKEERGLVYLCNDNSNVTNDFSVGGFGSTHRIRPSQGVPEPDGQGGIVYEASGNQFAYVGIDFANQGQQITYYYDPTGANETPITFTGNIAIQIANENTCPVVYCEPPCKTSTEVSLEKGKYYQSQANNTTALAAIETARLNGDTTLAVAKEEEAAYYRLKMDKEAYMVVLHLLYDTVNFDVDTLGTWVENLDLFGTDINWALQQQSAGNYTEATAALERATKRKHLSTQDRKDLQAMPLLMEVLKGRTARQVDPRYFKELEALAADVRSQTGNIAKNILRQHGYYFAPVYHFPNRENSDNTGIPPVPAYETKSVLNVYPNPSGGQFTLDWQPTLTSTETARLEVKDLSGRLILTQTIRPNTQASLDLRGQRAGLYYYQLHVPNESPLTGKLIIQ